MNRATYPSRLSIALGALAALLLLSACAAPGASPAPASSPVQGSPSTSAAPTFNASSCRVTWNDPALTLPSASEVAELQRTAPREAAAHVSGSPRPAVISSPARTRPQPGRPSYFLHVPPSHPKSPLWVLVTLHGFGEHGHPFGKPFVSVANAHHWILVSPTFAYRSLSSPLQTRTDDIRFTAELSAILKDVPARTGLAVHRHALLLGFSRGGSMVERFSLLHPNQVQAVAALSGGAYTLPQPCLERHGKIEPLPLPLGTADVKVWTGQPFKAAAFRRIPFWLSVGADDNQAKYLPSTYDIMIGKSRVQRGQVLDRALLGFGLTDVRLIIFPNTAHRLTEPMISGATRFLAQASTLPT